MLADLPRNVFAPADRLAVAAATRKPALVPAFGTMAYLASAASAAIGHRAPTASKTLGGQFPAFGSLVYLSGHKASGSTPAASLTSIAIHHHEFATPTSLV